MDNLIELDRRISRAIDRGKGIQLSDEDLDLLASAGAINVLKNAAAEAMVQLAAQRQREREEIRQTLSDPSAKSRAEEGRVALERARAIIDNRKRIPRSELTSTRKNK